MSHRAPLDRNLQAVPSRQRHDQLGDVDSAWASASASVTGSVPSATTHIQPPWPRRAKDDLHLIRPTRGRRKEDDHGSGPRRCHKPVRPHKDASAARSTLEHGSSAKGRKRRWRPRRHCEAAVTAVTSMVDQREGGRGGKKAEAKKAPGDAKAEETMTTARNAERLSARHSPCSRNPIQARSLCAPPLPSPLSLSARNYHARTCCRARTRN